MSRIDLHLHSTCSDGTLSPAELIDLAVAAGLSTVALCDHDTVAGIPEAMQYGAERQIEVIPGVELSVSFGSHDDVHLLGYGINIQEEQLLKRLALFSERRSGRNRDILCKINHLLTLQQREPLSHEEVEVLAGGVMGRPHIARALMARGYVASMQQAFELYLIPCNVPKYYWPMQEALSALHHAGGAAVLAHPTSISRDLRELEAIITQLAAEGLDGIEVYNSLATEQETAQLYRLALRLGLLITGGSDYHGISDTERIGKGRGGIGFPDTMLPPLCARIKQYCVTTVSG